MKLLGVVLLAIVSSACSGDLGGGSEAPGQGTDPGRAEGSVDGLEAGSLGARAAFELFRGHGHDAARASRAVRRAISAGAARLAELQADTTGDNARNGLADDDPDDGGWDFTLASNATAHTAVASPPNLFGETGLGAWAAVESGLAGNRALVAALDAGTGMQRNPDIDSPPDFVFGVLLGELADNPGFAEVARAHYDARAAAAGNAKALGVFIRDARHARNEDGLIPYDLGWLTLSAAALDAVFPGAGYAGDADVFAELVVEDLTEATPRFDFEDPAERFYAIGVAWAQIAASWVDARPLFRQLRSRLLDQQHANGAWPASATAPADDLQSTAIALETIALTDRLNARSERAVRRATRFLVGAQAATGGWPDAANIELPLVDAEIVLALALAHTDVGDADLEPSSPTARPRALEAAAYAQPVP
jgi:hypothetical protein